MQWIRTVLREIFGLFIDDGSFAVAILVWLAIVWLVLPHIAVPAFWSGPFLFVGLALILVKSAARRARG